MVKAKFKNSEIEQAIDKFRRELQEKKNQSK